MNWENLYKKYQDIIPYGVFGLLTTMINIAVYWLLSHPAGLPTMASTVIAWFTAVLFAYITNRKWVFQGTAHTKKEITKEISSFFACRLATGVVDWLCMLLFVDVFRFNDVVIKMGANIIVIILNYVASKLIIFKHKEN